MNDQLTAPPSSVQVQVQPSQPGFDVYAMLLQAHTSAVQNATDMRNHLKECNDRDRRNEGMFNDTKGNVDKLFERLEAQRIAIDVSLDKISDGINASNKWIYMIVGGITLGGVLIQKVNLASLFH